MTKEHGDTFGVDGYVQSLESGDSFTGVCMSKFPKLYTSNMCSLLCINYISILKITTGGKERRACRMGCVVAAILENTTYLIHQVFPTCQALCVQLLLQYCH